MADYWIECIREAFEDAGIKATDEQIETVASWVEGAHDNYGMAHGYDVIPNPVEIEVERKYRDLKREVEQREQWELRTQPCRSCCTTGLVRDGWGRDVTCLDCGGKGRY